MMDVSYIKCTWNSCANLKQNNYLLLLNLDVFLKNSSKFQFKILVVFFFCLCLIYLTMYFRNDLYIWEMNYINTSSNHIRVESVWNRFLSYVAFPLKISHSPRVDYSLISSTLNISTLSSHRVDLSISYHLSLQWFHRCPWSSVHNKFPCSSLVY